MSPNNDIHMLHRRRFIQGLAASTVLTALHQIAPATPATRKKILVFTRSQNFQHDVVKLEHGTCLVHEIWKSLGKKNGFDVECTKDGRIFERDTLAHFDAFFFFTTGNLVLEKCDDGSPPMSVEGKSELLKAIESGKGFIGSHCASDTFHSAGDQTKSQSANELDPFIQMLGGEFIKHGPQQIAKMRIVSADFPGLPKVNEFSLHEEWYSLKNFANDIHVLLAQETARMTGPEYQRPNYPATWVRRHGRGNVYYTSLGHRDDVWTNPLFQEMLVGAVQWVTGQARFDVRPNLNTVTPQAATMPPLHAEQKK